MNEFQPVDHQSNEQDSSTPIEDKALQDYRALQARIIQTVMDVMNDPQTAIDCENFHRLATKISWEKLIRPFDI